MSKIHRFACGFIAVLFVVAFNARSLAAPSAARSAVVKPAGPLSLARFQKRPKLVVVLVIDQFRADYLTRFASRFLPARAKNGDVGGFQYLMTRGAYYPAARYDVLQSMTCPGHTMILTGSYPYQNGIPLNEWYDAKLGKIVNCADDPDSPLVGESGGDGGASPMHFIGTTFGDELKNAGLPSRVAAVALKDRSAIYLGGRRPDIALWMSKAYSWVTSRHYRPDGELPAWTKDLNAALAKRKGETYRWRAGDKQTGYSDPAKAPFDMSYKIGERDSLKTPLGLELTADAAIAAVRGLGLGKSGATDLLAVSFSTHDFLGHELGANAREMEEMTIAEDRIIARFLNDVRRAVPGGLDDVVIALTADHGVSPGVEYARAARLGGGHISEDEIMGAGETAMKAAFGEAPGGKWLASLKSFNIYFSGYALTNKKIAAADAEAVLKRAMLGVNGIAFAVGRSDRELGRLPPGQHARQSTHSQVDGRSGDVILIPKPFFMEKSRSATTHMTGYAYDRTVPLIVAGPGLRSGVYAQEANVIDLAPTLSFLAGVLPPALSEGRVLSEALGD